MTLGFALSMARSRKNSDKDYEKVLTNEKEYSSCPHNAGNSPPFDGCRYVLYEGLH